MLEFLKTITRSDVYNVFVPIGSIILGAFIQFIVSCFNRERQWKVIKEKASTDRVWGYLVWTMLFGLMLFLAYFVCVFLIENLLEIKIGIKLFKDGYFALYICMFGYLLTSHQNKKNMIVFCRDVKNEKLIKWLIYKIPMIVSFLFWGFLFSEQAKFVLKLDTIIIVVFEIFFLTVLESNRNLNYDEAKFFFYGGTKIEHIDIHTVKQKKDWIIAKSMIKDTEYRFRIKDIERIEYE